VAATGHNRTIEYFAVSGHWKTSDRWSTALRLCGFQTKPDLRAAHRHGSTSYLEQIAKRQPGKKVRDEQPKHLDGARRRVDEMATPPPRRHIVQRAAR
jgi:hypothetical protein